MSNHYNKLMELLKTFDGDLESDGQLWSDAGADLSEEELKQFNEEDWGNLNRHKKELTHGQKHLLALLLEKAPKERAIPLLVWLVSETQGEVWIDALELLSIIYSSNPANFDAKAIIDSSEKILHNFEIEMRRFINFPLLEEMTFNEYFNKYSHLAPKESIHFYDYLLKNT